MYIVVFEEKSQSVEGIRTYSSFVDRETYLRFLGEDKGSVKPIAEGVTKEQAKEMTLDNNYTALIRIVRETAHSGISRQSYLEAISASMQRRDLKYSAER